MNIQGIMRAILLAMTGLGPSAIALAQDQLTIGAVFSLSGNQSTYGEEASQGMELALDKIRAEDPALARRIVAIKEDDKSNPVDAAASAKRLLGVSKVDIMFSSIASSQALSMVGAIKESGKPFVVAASSNPEITQKGDFVFRTCYSDPFQGSIVANFASKNLGKKKVAILSDHKSDYSKGFTEFFEASFKAAGGEIVAQESYESGKKDFKTQLTKIRRKKPDLLIVPGYYQEVGLIMKQARQIGFQITMLGGDGWDSPTLFELAGEQAVQGHYFSSHFSVDDVDPVVKEFVTNYRTRYKKTPGSMAALSYDGILVIADAFKRANSNKPEALKKALASTRNLKVVTGVISINAARDAEKDAVILETKADKAVFAAKVAAKGMK